MKTFIKVVTLVLASTLSVGCASQNMTGLNYDKSEARRPQSVSVATVTHVTPVVLSDSRAGVVGGAAGAVVGGVLGSYVGGGTGKTIATGLGLLGGMVVGSNVESKLKEADGQEITLLFKNGNSYSVVQEINELQGMFKVGETVQVTYNGQTLRVKR